LKPEICSERTNSPPWISMLPGRFGKLVVRRPSSVVRKINCEQRATCDVRRFLNPRRSTEKHADSPNADGGRAMANFVRTFELNSNISSHDWHVQPSCQRPIRVSA
jgi:hypothetical protein